MPVHVGGCPCKIRELREIAEDHHLLLIEDAAESLGSRIGDEKVGSYGESAMFSFCAPKVITTGEGGVIVTDSLDITERLKLLRSHGRAETRDYFSTNEYLDYVTLGYNFRLSNIIAALGIAQLKKIDEIIGMRRENSRFLTQLLERRAPAVRTPRSPKDYYHLFQMYTVRCRHRDGLMKYLGDQGIMAKVYFPPVHLTHFYRNVLGYRCDLPVTEKLARECLTLPMYPALSRDEMITMADQIASFFQGVPA
jgi:perosamine synthetase